jgi:hypothetical protein
MTRPTDHAYEALAEVTNTDMQAGRGELNKSLSLIRSQTSKQGVELGLEIRARARAYRQVMGDVLLTPTALAKHWARVEAEADRNPAATNQAVPPTHCETCGGDRFVVYSLRPAQTSTWMRERGLTPSGFYEEMAACPDCGPDLGPRHPDPAQVRERAAL